MSLQRFVILKKIIVNGYLDVCILCNAESFFSFKEGVEGPDDDTAVHFVSPSAYLAGRTTEVNGAACGAYFFFSLPRFKYVV